MDNYHDNTPYSDPQPQPPHNPGPPPGTSPTGQHSQPIPGEPSSVPPPPPPGHGFHTDAGPTGSGPWPPTGQPPRQHQGMQQPPPPRARSFMGSLLRSIFISGLMFSILLNIYFGIALSSQMIEETWLDGDRSQKIALIDLNTSIDMNTAAKLRSDLRRAAKDDNVKGAILVINSPGGQIVPSELGLELLESFRQDSDKPLYAAIQQVGASGAYWIATGADTIYAETNAMVGSIGVIYINMVLEEALEQKLGVQPVIVKSSRSPFKDRSSPFRMPSEEELADIRQDIDTIHERFVKAVSHGRELEMDKAWELANGNVFDGPESLEKGLIDKVGSLAQAVNDMANAEGLSDPMVVRYTEPPSLGDMFRGSRLGSELDPLDIHAHLERIAMTPRIMALWTGR